MRLVRVDFFLSRTTLLLKIKKRKSFSRLPRVIANIFFSNRLVLNYMCIQSLGFFNFFVVFL